MDCDGTKKGFDLELTRSISDAVEVPIIASGGVGNPQHMADGIKLGRASAVLAASIFHFGECSIKEVKKEMQNNGISDASLMIPPIRLNFANKKRFHPLFRVCRPDLFWKLFSHQNPK